MAAEDARIFLLDDAQYLDEFSWQLILNAISIDHVMVVVLVRPTEVCLLSCVFICFFICLFVRFSLLFNSFPLFFLQFRTLEMQTAMLV
jgi:hypothetical protein